MFVCAGRKTWHIHKSFNVYWVDWKDNPSKWRNGRLRLHSWKQLHRWKRRRLSKRWETTESKSAQFVHLQILRWTWFCLREDHQGQSLFRRRNPSTLTAQLRTATRQGFQSRAKTTWPLSHKAPPRCWLRVADQQLGQVFKMGPKLLIWIWNWSLHVL